MYKASYRWWWWKPPAGFRFSITDAAAIAVCAAATWGTWPMLGETAIAFPIVLGHFFLFCNIFRVPRSPELLWSGVFVVNTGAWLSAGRFTWSAVLWTQMPVTLTVVLAAVLQSDYHGVGYLYVPWGRRADEQVPGGSGPTTSANTPDSQGHGRPSSGENTTLDQR
jgi:hypothetical protein